ncbi:universal stress protein UspA-like protein [Aequorivita sublithincola DSM 14238]|uniref:Universal stress protein UspA-like protein n=1 Tax=Aequorivita sublithincola (strain DSM 14238 / LMG 21431 / ACAM 643 / 9-3) TaxID=746697 RepID=I3YTU1_AEQSU|nr:universal stress protein [Aequorivita sublithincola]AFL80409.1 universal stress protein UspA-like protein [Aequorivita sublithincola DSM 14238]
MKRILVPTDFSEQAENALKVAINLAKQHHSEIYVLHSMEMPLHLSSSSNSGSLPESLYFIKLAEKRFNDLREKDYLKDIALNEAIGHNEIYEDIESACKKNKIDLIVMGSNGASGFKEMFVGSNTEKVVRTSNTPVLVIKNNHPEFNITDFVFATDFSDEGRGALTKAQKFAKKVDAKMHLLYVNTPAGFKTSVQAQEIMENFVRGMDVENYSLNIYNDTSVEKGILNFTHFINAQLIGMGTHGRKGISHFLNGSISEDMVNHANMPVITFKI